MNGKLVVAYDGAGFHGFAVNDGVRTVAGTLTEAISTVVREPVTLTGAGRTDAGVHAWGQVISVDLPDGVDLADLARRVNKLCAPEIAVRSVELVGDDFDARFSAHWRHYRYDVWNAPYPNPLLAAARGTLLRRSTSIGMNDRGAALRRRARLRLVLPAAQGSGRCNRADPRAQRAVHRLDGRRSGWPTAALRDPGQRLLPSDGPLDRRHARRRRRRQAAAATTCRRSSPPATARRPARSPRRTASRCGRSATDG